MTHFAQINDDNVVCNVIVSEQEHIDSGLMGDPDKWIQTSYNTNSGIHPDDKPLRKNFAGIGHTYDVVRDAFIENKPFTSWILDEFSCKWVSPIAMPTDGNIYQWDEATTNWILNPTQ